METAADYHLHQQSHAFTDDIATAARLFITMLRNCTYDEPFNIELFDSDVEDSVSEEPARRRSADVLGKRARPEASASAKAQKNKKAKKSTT